MFKRRKKGKKTKKIDRDTRIKKTEYLSKINSVEDLAQELILSRLHLDHYN